MLLRWMWGGSSHALFTFPVGSGRAPLVVGARSDTNGHEGKTGGSLDKEMWNSC